MVDTAAQPRKRMRVLIADDEDFVRMTIAEVLRSAEMDVATAATVTEALDRFGEIDPHVVISDLDFGPGPSGADLLLRIHDQSPWVGLVALTSHVSPALAIPDSVSLPPTCLYLVKSQLHSMNEVVAAVEAAIERSDGSASVRPHTPMPRITKAQAEILHLMAEGLSNAGIAERRETSVRAVEALVQRTIQALGIEPNPDYSTRVLAVLMWQRGEVDVE